MTRPAGLSTDRRGLLIVSLPRNDPELARAAADAGADLLKVHVNIRHRASRTVFGSLAEERARLDAVLAVGLPTGLVPGQEAMVGPDELPSLRRFAFLDAYLTHLPLYLYAAGVPVVPAIPHDYAPELVAFLDRLPGEWAEVPLVPPDGYGRPPVGADLVALARVAAITPRHLIVPTQRRIGPDDLERYFAIPSVRAIMIGAVVTGMEEEGVARETARFRERLDRLFG